MEAFQLVLAVMGVHQKWHCLTRYEQGAAHRNDTSMCVQVAFSVAGCTNAVYCKTLHNALGMRAVHGAAFLQTIKSMYPVVKDYSHTHVPVHVYTSPVVHWCV